jgi:hypothetical protein
VLPAVVPLEELPDVVPEVVPLVVPDVLPEVEPLVVPRVVPEVVPEVVPLVVPSVLPVPEPEVVPVGELPVPVPEVLSEVELPEPRALPEFLLRLGAVPVPDVLPDVVPDVVPEVVELAFLSDLFFFRSDPLVEVPEFPEEELPEVVPPDCAWAESNPTAVARIRVQNNFFIG